MRSIPPPYSERQVSASPWRKPVQTRMCSGSAAAPRTAERAQPAVAREAGEVRQARAEVVGEARMKRPSPRARRLHADACCHANRRALARLEVALCHELVICRRHDAARHAELRRQRATRGQSNARAQPPVADRVAQRPFELLAQRQPAAALEGDQQVNWPSLKPHDWNCTRGHWRSTVAAMNEITVIGGGVAGLTAAIGCAERGTAVRLFEAHETLGGRARSTDGPYKANLGPHAVYKGGVLFDWLE